MKTHDYLPHVMNLDLDSHARVRALDALRDYRVYAAQAEQEFAKADYWSAINSMGSQANAVCANFPGSSLDELVAECCREGERFERAAVAIGQWVCELVSGSRAMGVPRFPNLEELESYAAMDAGWVPVGAKNRRIFPDVETAYMWLKDMYMVPGKDGVVLGQNLGAGTWYVEIQEEEEKDDDGRDDQSGQAMMHELADDERYDY